MDKRIDHELIKRMLERRPGLSGVLAERRQAVAEMANMLIVLISDIREPKVGSEEFHERRHRRAFVRAVFAFIEGMTYALKMDALANSRVFDPNFTEAETLFLGGGTLESNDKGEAIAEPGALIPLKKNLRLTFASCARAHYSDFRLDVGSAGWGSFRKALDVRNRLTHPKSAAGCEITDDEVTVVVEAQEWFASNVLALSRGVLKSQMRIGKEYHAYAIEMGAWDTERMEDQFKPILASVLSAEEVSEVEKEEFRRILGPEAGTE